MMRAASARALFFFVIVGCGLETGGIQDDAGLFDAAQDASADLNVDRGTMTNDSGMQCECVPPDAESDGWTYIGGLPAAGACPDGYGGMPSATLLWDPRATGYDCSCSCSATNPTCSVPGALVFHYGKILCGGITKTSPSGITIGQCKDYDQGSLNGGAHNEQTVKIESGLSQQAGSCADSVVRSAGTITTSDAQICGYSGVQSKCVNGDACIVAPPTPYRLCVAKLDPTGAITACPNGFPKGIDGVSAGPTRTGTATDDSALVCPACTCSGSPGACNFAVDVGDDTCSNGGGNTLFTAKTGCATDGQGTNGFQPLSFTVSASPAISCSPSYTMTPAVGAPALAGTISAVCCR